MIYGIEQFRQTGKTADRLTKIVQADFRVRPPVAGSFYDVITAAAPLLGDHFLQVPFQRVMTWVLDKILPRSTEPNRLADIADKQADAIGLMARSAVEREATERERAIQETERLRIIAGMLRDGQSAAAQHLQMALEIADKVGAYAQTPQRIEHPDGTAQFISDEIKAEVTRAKELEPFKEEFDRVSPEAEQRIVNKVRGLIPEIANPLRNSAKAMEITEGSERVAQAILNPTRVRQISTVSDDLSEMPIIGNIVKFDKNTGYGRIEPQGVRKGIPFSMTSDDRLAHRHAVIEAMKHPLSRVLMRATRDGIGNIVHFRLLDVLDESYKAPSNA
ncbi:hypothetical protein [Roseomonas marmotae]|uniref:DUF4393 domain-containing protein n=1 Tax=Roseomonas marmotae TaxID=2768161 RepID=A0ABS3K8W7_9PROT|nr:hypothetical protein [Roseomonas marmotae]MBO1073370.1 hypothetical protein [Roseomonas marmotae]